MATLAEIDTWFEDKDHLEQKSRKSGILTVNIKSNLQM